MDITIDEAGNETFILAADRFTLTLTLDELKRLHFEAQSSVDAHFIDTPTDDEKADDEFWHNMNKPLHVVAVYEKDRAYGGPEEGGWWYDTGTLVRCIELENADAVDQVADAMVLEYPRSGMAGSVLYRGGDYSVMVFHRDSEFDLGYWFDERLEPIQFYPHTRPHYE